MNILRVLAAYWSASVSSRWSSVTCQRAAPPLPHTGWVPPNKVRWCHHPPTLPSFQLPSNTKLANNLNEQSYSVALDWERRTWRKPRYDRELDEELFPSISVQVCYPSCNYVIHQCTAVWSILALDAVKVVWIICCCEGSYIGLLWNGLILIPAPDDDCKSNFCSRSLVKCG